MNNTGKAYGLIIPKKAKNDKGFVKKPSIFGDDSDDEAPKSKIPSKFGQVVPQKIQLKKQTQIEIEKAMADDPSIFEYDQIYDNLQEKKKAEDVRLSSNVKKESKYINNLMKAAKQRQKDEERRVEKKVQKEREAEGDEFRDKEAFVTESFRKKMLEMQQEEEKERRQAELDAKNDVTKQKDLSGFYRHMLFGEENKVKIKKEEDQHDNKKEVKDKEGKVPIEELPDDRDDPVSDSSDDTDSSSDSEDERRKKESTRKSDSHKKTGSSSHESSHKSAHSRREERDSQRSSSRYDEKTSHRHSTDRSKDRHRDSRRSEERKYKHRHDKDRSASRERDSRRKRSPSTERETKEKHKDSKRSHRRSSESKEEDRKESKKQVGKGEGKRETSGDKKDKKDESTKFAKRTTADAVSDAKARYLARKQGRSVAVSKEDD